MGLTLTKTRSTPDHDKVTFALDGDKLSITAPRKGRPPVTEVYALARCAGGFVLTKESNYERHYVAGGTCSCKAYEHAGKCKHRTTMLALYREGKVS